MKYRVLKDKGDMGFAEAGDVHYWHDLGEHDADTPEAAVLKAANNESGVYAAIEVENWKQLDANPSLVIA